MPTACAAFNIYNVCIYSHEVQVQAMQQKLAALASENERQSGIIMGLEQMVEEAGVEKLQLLKYCPRPKQTKPNFRIKHHSAQVLPRARASCPQRRGDERKSV